MTFIPNLQGKVDTNNSSTSQLSSSQTFTGTATDVSKYSSVSVSVTSDVNSANLNTNNGCQLQFSNDSTTWFTISKFSLVTPTTSTDVNASSTCQITHRYFRVVYQNGSSGTTNLSIQTILHPTSSSFQIEGKNIAQKLVPVTCDETGNLNTNISGPLTAFGELQVANLTPVGRVLFSYGINTNVTTAITANGGSQSVTNGICSIISGTSNGGTSTIVSKRSLQYQTGQGGLMRYTAIFTTGVANTIQIAGAGDTDDIDGYFFGYNGTSFGILHRNNSVDTWIPQASWNVDVMDGSRTLQNPSGQQFVPTVGNVFQISFQFLGFGAIRFYIENAYTGKFSLVHIIRYANLNTTTNLRIPSLLLMWRARCISGGTSVTVKTASGSLFSEGQKFLLGPKYGSSFRKSNISTETNIISLRCNTTINSQTNRSQLVLRNVSVSLSGSSNQNDITGILNVYLNATVSGTYTNIDSVNSIAATNTAGTLTLGTGKIIYNSAVANNSSSFIDTTPLDIFLAPGDVLTFAVSSTFTANIAVAFCWSEETS